MKLMITTENLKAVSAGLGTGNVTYEMVTLISSVSGGVGLGLAGIFVAIDSNRQSNVLTVLLAPTICGLLGAAGGYLGGAVFHATVRNTVTGVSKFLESVDYVFAPSEF